MHLLRRRVARGLVVGGLIASIGLPAVTANAQESSGNSIVSSAGDVIAAGGAESNPQGGSGNSGTGGESADKSASAADNQAVPGRGGGSASESVISPDKRVQFTNSAAATYPNRAVVYMTFTQAGSGFSCTGFFVSPDTVATAGHCVHKGTGGSGGFSSTTSFRLYPGRNGSNIPYKCSNGAIVTAKKLWTNTSWSNGGGETVDYGAVEIKPCSNGALMGNTVGWFGYRNTQSAPESQLGKAENTQGYPGDKPSATQWLANNCSTSSTFVQCTVAAVTTRQLFYKNDTFGGQSGSPVYRKINSCTTTGTPTTGSSHCAIAIHAYGLHGSSPHSTNNHGTRIENNVTSFLNTVRSS